jgi:hypothetical protein
MVLVREETLQQQLLQVLAWDCRTKAVKVVSIPNEGVGKGASKLQAIIRTNRLKKMGLCTGFPDLMCLYNGRVLFLELKTQKGILSNNQDRQHKELQDLGFRVEVVRDVEKGIELVAEWVESKNPKQPTTIDEEEDFIKAKQKLNLDVSCINYQKKY